MKLPFLQKAKLVSDKQFYLAHVKSKTLSILCFPPASSWIKVVGCLCKLPFSTSFLLPLPPPPALLPPKGRRGICSLSGGVEAQQTPSPRAAERAAGAALTLPARRGRPRPAVLSPLSAPQAGRLQRRPASHKARPPLPGFSAENQPHRSSPGGQNRFAVIGA
uniref:Uncharacterized protein n=1 Tax=Pipistrellus kuhlii TaxID=59472 RepID=A0A7J7V0J0_PIPKU|nr:hypothetical protein mPipKuh1_008613 [Pipistrellus kuhlii]